MVIDSNLIMGGITALGICAAAAPAVFSHIRDERAKARQHELDCNRAKSVKQLIDTAMDYDFARDCVAGRESTSYMEQAKDLIEKSREDADGGGGTD